MTHIVSLPTGADARLHNEAAPAAVVLVNGGTARALPGTWSATSELLATELAPRFPELAFAEVRYRIKTWNELDSCIADARAALDLVARPSLLVGFSMGGAVSIAVAGHPRWRPCSASPRGSRSACRSTACAASGSTCSTAPGTVPAGDPGGEPGELAEWLRTRAAARDRGHLPLIPRGLHGAAIRRGSGGILRLPRAGAWVEGVRERLELFRRVGAGGRGEGPLNPPTPAARGQAL